MKNCVLLISKGLWFEKSAVLALRFLVIAPTKPCLSSDLIFNHLPLKIIASWLKGNMLLSLSSTTCCSLYRLLCLAQCSAQASCSVNVYWLGSCQCQYAFILMQNSKRDAAMRFLFVLYKKLTPVLNSYDSQTLATPITITSQKVLSWETNKITSSLKTTRDSFCFVLVHLFL